MDFPGPSEAFLAQFPKHFPRSPQPRLPIRRIVRVLPDVVRQNLLEVMLRSQIVAQELQLTSCTQKTPSRKSK